MQLRSGILIHLALPSTNFVGPLATDSKPEVSTVDVKSGKAFAQGYQWNISEAFSAASSAKAGLAFTRRSPSMYLTI